MQNLSSQKLFLGLAALAGVGLIIVALTSFRPQSEPQVVTPPPSSIPPVTAKVPKKIGIVLYLKFHEPTIEGVKVRMAELGYTEGKDVVYDVGLAEGKIDKVEEITKDYIAKNVDLILAISSVSGRAALKATKEAGRTDIPIVFAHADNPDKTGMIQSFKSSGNNSTGVATNLAELTSKKVEFLRKMAPEAKKLGVFVGKISDPAGDLTIAELRKRAPEFGMELVEYTIENPPGPESTKEMQRIADNLKPGEIDALFRMPGATMSTADNIGVVIALGKRLKIFTIMLGEGDVERGGIFTYTDDVRAIGSQAAVFVDKIFKGTKPSDIPIEFGKILMVFNLKTAKEIGVTIPDSLLAIADKKIE